MMICEAINIDGFSRKLALQLGIELLLKRAILLAPHNQPICRHLEWCGIWHVLDAY